MDPTPVGVAGEALKEQDGKKGGNPTSRCHVIERERERPTFHPLNQ